jgi:PAS domain S-box-containing protein
VGIRSFLHRHFGRQSMDDRGPAAVDPRGLSLAHFERMVDIAADAIISVDESMSIVVFNQGAREIFGYEPEEILGRPLDLLLPERFRAYHEAHIRHFASSGASARHMGDRREIAGLTKSGREFPAEATISRLEAGGQSIYTVVLRDITERKKIEETQRFLADSSDVLSRSLDYEATLAGLARLTLPRLADWCVVDIVEGGTIRRIQAAHRDPDLDALTRRLVQWPPHPDRPHPSITVLETGEPELIESVTDAFLEGVAASPEHLEVLRTLGLRSFLAVPLIAHDRPLGILGLASASADRPYEREERLLAEELARRAALAVDNARLYREARDAIAARDEVLGVVSHDLGNPLSAVRVTTRVVTRLLEGGETDQAARHLGAIRESVLQMERLIRDLLEVRRIESGRLKLVRRPEPVRPLVEEAVRSLQPLADEAGVTLEQHLHTDLPATIVVDADRIRQVFSNLIGNALKFTPSGGAITVGADPGRQAVDFWVRDTGPGLDADALAHVFDRFWQARQQGSHGIGLGLSIAKGLTEAHGGAIRVDSTPGEGSRFTFRIPVDDGAGS